MRDIKTEKSGAVEMYGKPYLCVCIYICFKYVLDNL